MGLEGSSKYNPGEACYEELGPTVSITFTQKTKMNIKVCLFNKIWATPPHTGRESKGVESQKMGH